MPAEELEIVREPVVGCVITRLGNIISVYPLVAEEGHDWDFMTGIRLMPEKEEKIIAVLPSHSRLLRVKGGPDADGGYMTLGYEYEHEHSEDSPDWIEVLKSTIEWKEMAKEFLEAEKAKKSLEAEK